MQDRKILYWTCSMHPQYRSDKPGTCPQCGMDLTPVFEDAGVRAERLPEGAFRISPEKQQLIGVQYGEVSIRSLSKTIRAVGRLAYDETRITRVHSKIGGWIERVFVDFTGDLIQKNQPLLTVYSPELVATQEEYLLALKARDQLGSSSFKDVSSGAGSLLEAARRRLELWDMTDEQIAQLDRTRKATKAVTLYSSAAGFVVTRNAFERQRIMPETELYTLADLSTVWAIADIYEFEAPFVHSGQPISMTLPAYPGRTFHGKVTYIYPQVDNATRALKVRAEFANPGFALKPDMYVNIELKVAFGRNPSVPAEAVLDSGSEQIVFVALEGGYFEPRKVQVGEKVGNHAIVLKGLKPGEKVVTSGNFLIDSESRLKSALSGMSMPGAGQESPQPSPPAGHSLSDHSQHAKKP